MDPKPSPDPEKDEKNRSLTWKNNMEALPSNGKRNLS